MSVFIFKNSVQVNWAWFDVICNTGKFSDTLKQNAVLLGHAIESVYLSTYTTASAILHVHTFAYFTCPAQKGNEGTQVWF